jgi:hypothetical protein
MSQNLLRVLFGNHSGGLSLGQGLPDFPHLSVLQQEKKLKMIRIFSGIRVVMNPGSEFTIPFFKFEDSIHPALDQT